jgi:hypothetical protein
MSSIGYVKKSSEKHLNERREYSLFNKTTIFIKDPLPKEINMTKVVKEIEKKLPAHLAYDLDAIYVGQFPELNTREVESVYMNGAIFISNKQESVDQMCSSVVHEIAHGVEERHGEDIYGDSEVVSEFLSKRRKLAKLFTEQGIKCNMKSFLMMDYNEEFDNFLYKEIGYDLLNRLSANLFVSPYAATSIREYFANGFECFFCKEPEYLEKVSPKLYSKILTLTTNN